MREKTGKYITYKQCKKLFYLFKWQEKQGKKFCSKKCYSLWMSKNQRGKNHAFYGKHHSQKTKTHLSKFWMGKRIGVNHPRWKGQTKTSQGYIYVVERNHPFKGKDNYISRSRLVMEKKLGRFLKPAERIHHINGIKDDDRPENLMYFPNESEHQKFHHKLKKH